MPHLINITDAQWVQRVGCCGVGSGCPPQIQSRDSKAVSSNQLRTTLAGSGHLKAQVAQTGNSVHQTSFSLISLDVSRRFFSSTNRTSFLANFDSEWSGGGVTVHLQSVVLRPRVSVTLL